MVDVMAGIGLSLQALGGIGSALFGGGGDAEREQRRILAESRGLYGDARGAIDDAEMRSLADFDLANQVLADLPAEVLAGLDSELQMRIGQQLRQDMQQQAVLEQRLAAGGLDMSTAGAGMRRSMRLGQGQAIGQMAAGFAGQRANALMAMRQAQASGLQSRGQMVGQFASQRANLFAEEGRNLMGVQIQPSNDGALFGAALGGLGSAFMNYSNLTASENYRNSMLDALRGGGGGPSVGAAIGSSTMYNDAFSGIA